MIVSATTHKPVAARRSRSASQPDADEMCARIIAGEPGKYPLIMKQWAQLVMDKIRKQKENK